MATRTSSFIKLTPNLHPTLSTTFGCYLALCRFQIRYEPLNLNRLQYFIDSGRIDPTKPINMNTLYWSGAVGKVEHGIKLLADVSNCIFPNIKQLKPAK